ncbi:MAG TPA: ABC transporter permease subunit [Blastocatellia bacterium]|nr:ABC transporter permease subunit [Blastocatellia bacterium]
MATTEITRQRVVGPAARSNPKMGGKVAAIAFNTFRESVRDRVLYNLILFVLILIGASVFVSELSLDEESEFILRLGLSLMLVFGAVIAIFIGVGLVFKEIDKRTIYNLLSKPVHRHEFIIGKFLGLCMTLLVNCAVMVVGIELALMYVNGGFVRVQLTMLPAAFLIYLELAIVVAVALMFSSFSTPMLAALFTFAVYVIGQLSGDLRLAAELTESALTRVVLTALYYLLPNLANFGFISQASRGVTAPLSIITWSTAYAIIYISILLSGAVLIFQKRNFK